MLDCLARFGQLPRPPPAEPIFLRARPRTGAAGGAKEDNAAAKSLIEH